MPKRSRGPRANRQGSNALGSVRFFAFTDDDARHASQVDPGNVEGYKSDDPPAVGTVGHRIGGGSFCRRAPLTRTCLEVDVPTTKISTSSGDVARPRFRSLARTRHRPTPCPSGRVTVIGVVTGAKWVVAPYGPVYEQRRNLTVKDDRGFTVNGTTAAKFLETHQIGDSIEFVADIRPKGGDDPSFGWFTKPKRVNPLSADVLAMLTTRPQHDWSIADRLGASFKKTDAALKELHRSDQVARTKRHGFVHWALTDEVDRSIAKLLRDDPRMPDREVARRLDLHVNTVRNRLHGGRLFVVTMRPRQWDRRGDCHNKR